MAGFVAVAAGAIVPQVAANISTHSLEGEQAWCRRRSQGKP